MELGELAEDVKAGKAGAMLELWEAVRRFVVMKAEQRAARPGCRVPAEDFIQAGFFAMLDAAEAYDPERGAGFLKALSFTLQKRFAEEQGVRSSKRETLLFFADSMDAPAMLDDDEGPTIAETIEDESAALPFLDVDFSEFLEYCRGTINATLATVNRTQAEVIRAHYFGGQSLRDIADQRGTSHQAVAAIEQEAFYKIMRGKYRRLLRECLDTFDEFHNSEEITEYIARPTEKAAVKNDRAAAGQDGAPAGAAGERQETAQAPQEGQRYPRQEKAAREPERGREERGPEHEAIHRPYHRTAPAPEAGADRKSHFSRRENLLHSRQAIKITQRGEPQKWRSTNAR